MSFFLILVVSGFIGVFILQTFKIFIKMINAIRNKRNKKSDTETSNSRKSSKSGGNKDNDNDNDSDDDDNDNDNDVDDRDMGDETAEPGHIMYRANRAPTTPRSSNNLYFVCFIFHLFQFRLFQFHLFHLFNIYVFFLIVLNDRWTTT